jgi:hypothetical protein
LRRPAKASSAGSVEGSGNSRGRFRRALAALAGTASLALAMALVAAPAASAAPWGFEQVTPPVKGAGALSNLDTFRTSPDGNSFLYTTNSEFSSVPVESQPLYVRYIGHRGADKWTNRALDAPYDRGVGSGATAPAFMSVLASSYNLRYVIVSSTIALTPGATEGGTNLYMRDTVSGEDRLIATHPNPKSSLQFSSTYGTQGISYVAPDGQSALFNSSMGMTPDGYECGEELNCSGSLYSWTASGGIEVASLLPAAEGGISIKDAGGLNPGENGPRESMPYTNGLDYIYFTQYAELNLRGIFVRTGDVTEPVSYSRITNDKSDLEPANIMATSDGGRYLLLQTMLGGDPLTADSPSGGEDTSRKYLYRYDALNPEDLTYVGMIGGNVGALQMSRDGQTVAFQSSRALLPGAVEEEANLYIWRDGELQLGAPSYGSTFAAKLSALSENGRYFAFTSNALSLLNEFGQSVSSPACRPLPFGEGDGPCDQVYVFDADATSNQLQCASCREDGAPQLGIAGVPTSGNDGAARLDAHLPQLVANDGTVFFATKDPVLDSDKNKLEDVYAYKDGEVRLLSRALQGLSSRFLDATTDGKSVFISTDDPIAPTDIDRMFDVYLTREGAGFPYTSPPAIPPCDGLETCRDGVPPALAPASPGSAFFNGRGNAKGDSKARKQKVSVAKAKAAVGPTASLSVKAPGKGTLKLSGNGVKTATKSVAKAATYRLKATLTGAAKRALEKSGQLKKKVKVTFTPRQGKPSSVTIQVTYKAAAKRMGN